MVQEIEKRLDVLFKTYKESFDMVEEACNEEDSISCDRDNDFLREFLHVEESKSVAIETEIMRALTEPKITFTTGFDILR